MIQQYGQPMLNILGLKNLVLKELIRLESLSKLLRFDNHICNSKIKMTKIDRMSWERKC